MSFLCLDIGNTRLKWALFNSPQPNSKKIAQGAVFIELINSLHEDIWLEFPTPCKAIGCSVASDAITRQVDRQLAEWGVTAQWVVPEEKGFGITNHYDYPAIMGADRWVALVAALHYLKKENSPLSPFILVLAGTATTAEAVDHRGNYLGGIILPGHGIMLKALQSGTARLNVPTGRVAPFPTNASDGLTTGGTYALTGAIERMAQNLEKLTQQSVKILMTGGAAWKISPHLQKPHELIENLILDGLLLIANSREKQAYSMP